MTTYEPYDPYAEAWQDAHADDRPYNGDGWHVGPAVLGVVLAVVALAVAVGIGVLAWSVIA